MCLNSDWAPQACQSPVGLQWGMSISDRSSIRHVGLRWVSDRSPTGLRQVSENNNIFVNSRYVNLQSKVKLNFYFDR